MLSVGETVLKIHFVLAKRWDRGGRMGGGGGGGGGSIQGGCLDWL